MEITRLTEIMCRLMSIQSVVTLWRCRYLLSSCWVDQSENNQNAFDTLFMLCSTVQCTHMIFFSCLCFSSYLHVIMCNDNYFCVKLTLLHYVNLTYKGMSMRAGLTYKGITCVLYQHTWIWHTCTVCYLRGQSNDTQIRVKITRLVLQCIHVEDIILLTIGLLLSTIDILLLLCYCKHIIYITPAEKLFTDLTN